MTLCVPLVQTDYGGDRIRVFTLVDISASQTRSISLTSSQAASPSQTATQTPSVIAIPPILGNVGTVAGSTTGYADGVGTNALFNDPSWIAQSSDGTFLIVVSLGMCVFVSALRSASHFALPLALPFPDGPQQ